MAHICPESDFEKVTHDAEADGFSHVMEKHVAVFRMRSPERLIVSFDNLSGVTMTPPRVPWGQDLCEKNGWSQLSIMTRQNDWYRHGELEDFFDELRDSGFFDQFENVVFYGTSMGGYGALSYVAAAPGARVVAFAPQTSLDPKLVPDEKRYARGRDLGDWTGRYADAAEGVKAASKAHIFWDPLFAPDDYQVARLKGDNIIPYRVYRMGHKIPRRLLELGILSTIATRVIQDGLTPFKFTRFFRRARRTDEAYREKLVHSAIERGHLDLAHAAIERELKRGGGWKWRRVKREIRLAKHYGRPFDWAEIRGRETQGASE